MVELTYRRQHQTATRTRVTQREGFGGRADQSESDSDGPETLHRNQGDSSAAIRLIGAVLADQHEWAIARRHLSESSMARLNQTRDTDRPQLAG
jgi:hypothetical protein